jgi:hypothetical protein
MTDQSADEPRPVTYREAGARYGTGEARERFDALTGSLNVRRWAGLYGLPGPSRIRILGVNLTHDMLRRCVLASHQ